MARLKLLKFPKKPRKRASNDAKLNWLAKVEEIKIENNNRIRAHEEGKKLDQKIASIGGYKKPSRSVSVRRKRSSGGKKRKGGKRRRK